MRLLNAILALLGAGCQHQRTSRVFREPDGRRRHYVVCLECGAEFEYSLSTMRRGRRLLRPPSHPDQVALERAFEEHQPLAEELIAFPTGRLTEPFARRESAGLPDARLRMDNRRSGPDEPDKSGLF